MKKFLIISLTILLPIWAAAQDAATRTGKQRAEQRMEQIGRTDTKRAVELSTNLFDWAYLGTINLDAGVSVARHLSVHAGLKYNPWTFKLSDGPITQMQNQQKTASLGVRWWPWYVFSGWWVAGKVQYSDYANTGVWRQAYDKGKALGAGISAGYTLMINKHFNVEFGAGFWGGGLLEHEIYDCPKPSCMEKPREGVSKAFIDINDVNISLHWVF